MKHFFPGYDSFLLKVHHIMSAGLLGFYLLSEYSRNLLYFFLSVCYLRLFYNVLFVSCLFAHYFIDNFVSYLVRSSSSFISSNRNQLRGKNSRNKSKKQAFSFYLQILLHFFQSVYRIIYI